MKVVFPAIKENEKFFFIIYGIYLIVTILGTSFYARYMVPFYGAAIKACILAVFIQDLFVNKYTPKSLVIALLFTALGLISVRYSMDPIHLLSMLVFIYCARNINFEKIALFTIFVSGFLLVFVIFSAFFGIIDDYKIVDERVRDYLGFRYSLFGPTILFNITSLYIYLRKNKATVPMLLLLFVFNTWIFAKTDGRLSYGVSLMVLAAAILLKNSKVNIFIEKSRLIKWVAVFSYVLCFIVSIYTAINYNHNVKWQRDINRVLTGRLWLSHNAMLNHGAPLFGEKIEYVGNGLDAYGNNASKTRAYTYIDNLYIQMLHSYGVLFIAFYLLVHTYTVYKCYKEKNYYAMMILFVIAIRCIIDDLSFRLYYNTFWFIVGNAVIGNIRVIQNARKINKA